jgi:antitoxin component HigA of HigAB toxin-antitoxin module
MTMDPIKNDSEYAAAMQELEELMRREEGLLGLIPMENDRLEELVEMIEKYEQVRWPTANPPMKWYERAADWLRERLGLV